MARQVHVSSVLLEAEDLEQLLQGAALSHLGPELLRPTKLLQGEEHLAGRLDAPLRQASTETEWSSVFKIQPSTQLKDSSRAKSRQGNTLQPGWAADATDVSSQKSCPKTKQSSAITRHL